MLFSCHNSSNSRALTDWSGRTERLRSMSRAIMARTSSENSCFHLKTDWSDRPDCHLNGLFKDVLSSLKLSFLVKKPLRMYVLTSPFDVWPILKTELDRKLNPLGNLHHRRPRSGLSGGRKFRASRKKSTRITIGLTNLGLASLGVPSL